MFLESKGHKFESETDTEIIAKMVKHIRLEGSEKRNSRIRLKRFHNWLKLQLCFLIGGYHKVRKKGNLTV